MSTWPMIQVGNTIQDCQADLNPPESAPIESNEMGLLMCQFGEDRADPLPQSSTTRALDERSLRPRHTPANPLCLPTYNP